MKATPELTEFGRWVRETDRKLNAKYQDRGYIVHLYRSPIPITSKNDPDPYTGITLMVSRALSWDMPRRDIVLKKGELNVEKITAKVEKIIRSICRIKPLGPGIT